MSGKTVVLMGWAAWAPGLFAKEDWRSFFQLGQFDPHRPDPLVPEISPLMRRRMTRTARMAAAVAFRCLEEGQTSARDVPIVYSSRHGEMSALIEILGALAKGEGVSPTAFSHSVHHTTASAFSIATGNTRELRSVAGGVSTFSYGFLDGVGLLNEKDISQVLFISADDAVPGLFDGVVDSRGTPHAVALLLGRDKGIKGTPLHFHFKSHETPPLASIGAKSDLPHPLEFIRWIESTLPSLTLSHGGIQWVWTR